MIIVPWAAVAPTLELATSAQPNAPVVSDEPRGLATLWRRLIRQA